MTSIADRRDLISFEVEMGTKVEAWTHLKPLKPLVNARLNQNSMTAPHCCHLQYPWIFNSKHVLVGMRDEIIIIWIELSPKMHFQSRNLFSRASKEWKKIFLKYFRWNIFWLLVGNPCLFEKGHLEIWGLTLYEIVRTRKSGLSVTTYGKYFRIEFAGDW